MCGDDNNNNEATVIVYVCLCVYILYIVIHLSECNGAPYSTIVISKCVYIYIYIYCSINLYIYIN